MYLIRRIYKTKPGEALLVASLVAKQAQVFRDAGQRGPFRVTFNGYTVPGNENTVWLEWEDSKLESPYRGDNDLPSSPYGAKIRELIESQRIEFMEVLTPDKAQEV